MFTGATGLRAFTCPCPAVNNRVFVGSCKKSFRGEYSSIGCVTRKIALQTWDFGTDRDIQLWKKSAANPSNNLSPLQRGL